MSGFKLTFVALVLLSGCANGARLREIKSFFKDPYNQDVLEADGGAPDGPDGPELEGCTRPGKNAYSVYVRSPSRSYIDTLAFGNPYDLCGSETQASVWKPNWDGDNCVFHLSAVCSEEPFQTTTLGNAKTLYRYEIDIVDEEVSGTLTVESPPATGPVTVRTYHIESR